MDLLTVRVPTWQAHRHACCCSLDFPTPASCCQQAMRDLSFQLPWKQEHSHFKVQIFQPNSLFMFSLYYHLTLFCNRLKVDAGLFGGIYNAGYMQPTYLHALIFGPGLRKAIQWAIKLAAMFVIFGPNEMPRRNCPAIGSEFITL